MATFVQLSEQDPALALVELIVGLKYPQPEQKGQKENERTSLSQLVTAQKYGDVMERGVLASMDTILAAQPADINTVFNISFSIIQQLEPEQARKVIGDFAVALGKDHKHDSLKIKLLTTLFNLTDSSVRYTVFLSIIRFALATNNSSKLADQLSHVDEWIKEWKLNSERTAEILVLLSQVCRANQQFDLEQKYLYRYFQIVEQSPALLAAAAAPAVSAAVQAIESTEVIHGDTLLRMAAVRQLRSGQHSKVYELLKIVVSDNVQAYHKYYDENKGQLPAPGLDHEKILRKMRALTICSLAKGTTELAYDVLAKELLAKTDNDVEEAVIDAVVTGLIDARIDQDQRTVHIQRTTARNFDQNTWKELSQKLAVWKRNMMGVRENLDQVMRILENAQTQQQQKA